MLVYSPMFGCQYGENLARPELEWLVQEGCLWLNLPTTHNNIVLGKWAFLNIFYHKK